MNEDKYVIYQMTSTGLEKVIREIIQSEFKKLEEKITREPKVLSREDASKMIGYSPNTISSFVKNGLLPNRGKGKRILILESDLLKIPKKRGFVPENLD